MHRKHELKISTPPPSQAGSQTSPSMQTASGVAKGDARSSTAAIGPGDTQPGPAAGLSALRRNDTRVGATTVALTFATSEFLP